jgi:hypothetical protein
LFQKTKRHCRCGMLASSKCQRSWNHKERRLDGGGGSVCSPQGVRSGAVMATPLRTADTTTPPLVYGSDDHQSLPDLDSLRIAMRKSLQPINWQCLDAAAKFREQRRRIAPRAAYNFQFQTLALGSAYDHKLPVSVRLEKVFVRFKPTYFGCSAPQIHREDWSG